MRNIISLNSKYPAKKKGGKGLKIGLIIAAVVVVFALIIGIAAGSGGDEGGNNGGSNGGGNTVVNGGSNNGGSNNGGSNNGGIVIETPTTESNIEKTIMIYMVGSDLESKYGSATLDLAEMLESGVDTDKNNVLVYTGGAKQWQNEIVPSDKNCIFKISGEDIVLEKEFSNDNMGESDTLSEFISYCTKNYSADKYGLILWNHGAGPFIGYGVDETHRNDLLSMDELSSAISDAGFGSGKKFEFIGFDACLMGTIETAWALKDYANYMLASQEAEPGWGWNYAFLKYLNNYDSGYDIGKVIIDSYFIASNELIEANPELDSDLTLSCMDLSKIGKVEDGLNGLFAEVDEKLGSGSFAKVSKHRTKVKEFGKFSTSFYYDLIDISHMATLLSADHSAEAGELKNALNDFVCYSRSNVENASGVSIYHPYNNKDYMSSWIKAFGDIGFASEYADYISDFKTMLLNPSSDSWRGFSATKVTAVSKDNKNELSIKLTEEQTETYASSAYYILKKLENDEYLFVFAGFDTTLAEDGTLSASYDNKAVFAIDDKTKAVSDSPVTMYQVRDGSDDLRYCISSMFWDFGDDIADFKVDPVEWMMKIEDGKPKLLQAYLIEGDAGNEIPQKQLLNYKDYTSVEFSFSTRKPKNDENGDLLPYFKWDSTGNFYGNSYDVKSGFHLECREIDNKDDYYVMFVVNDVNGNQYASEMFTLPN